MSVNDTVNQSKSATAGGSGDSPEKLVADHVDNLWEHIAADGYDLLADVAVESLTRNGDVPPDAYLRSVKMSWCLHRAAVHYALQYSKERVSADFARGDAQFEHSLRAQAERKAEKLEADLAQSVLLVENLRLRLDEARAQGAKWCEEINKLKGSLGARREELTASFTANQELRQKLETAEAALLEQQQRNEELVTQNSQQFMKIAGLQGQVEGAKTQELEGQTQELEGQTQELEGKTQVLPAEYIPPEGWRVLAVGEVLQASDLWVNHEGEWLTRRVGERVNDERYIRRIEPQPEPQPPMLQDADQRIRTLRECNARQAELIANLKYEKAGALQKCDVLARENRSLTDNIEELQFRIRDLETVYSATMKCLEDAELGIRQVRQCNQDQYEKIVSMREELNQVKGELAGAIQSRDLFAETNREQAGKIEHLQRQVEALTILGL